MKHEELCIKYEEFCIQNDAFEAVPPSSTTRWRRPQTPARRGTPHGSCVPDAICFVHTCRRLIDLERLIAGTLRGWGDLPGFHRRRGRGGYRQRPGKPSPDLSIAGMFY